MRRVFSKGVKNCVVTCHAEYEVCSETEKQLLQVGNIRAELEAEVENVCLCLQY